VSYWSTRKVLVTGGTGFLGRAVCAALEKRGADFVAAGSAHGDLTTMHGTQKAFACQPAVVIHCAALCRGIGANRAQPYDFAAVNLAMSLNVVAECLRANAKLVAIGSVCSYPKHCPAPFAEADIWNGYPEETNAPYGNAKRMLLELTQAAHRQYGLRAAVVVPTNLYGPHDNFDLQSSHVIPAMIRRFIEAGDGDVTCWGTGTATREFLYVEDAAEAIVRAAERIDVPRPINVGSGEEIGMVDLAAKVADAVGYRGRITWDRSQPDGQPRRLVDYTRARETLGYSPAVNLDEGLRRTVKWWRER
jgi:GDP-L-fucose synthase